MSLNRPRRRSAALACAFLAAVAAHCSRSDAPATSPDSSSTSAGCQPDTPQELARQQQLTRDAQLTEAEVLRVCMFTRVVRSAQRMLAAESDPARRRAGEEDLAREVDRALPSLVPPQKAPSVRTYLLTPTP